MSSGGLCPCRERPLVTGEPDQAPPVRCHKQSELRFTRPGAQEEGLLWARQAGEGAGWQVVCSDGVAQEGASELAGR